MSGGQLGQLAQVRPPVGPAPGAAGPGGPLTATATQGMPPMGPGGVPQQQLPPWAPAYNIPPNIAGAKSPSTPFYPQPSGGFYNQMTQRLAGPGYSPNQSPYGFLNSPAGGGGGYGGGFGFGPGGGFPTAPGGGYHGGGR